MNQNSAQQLVRVTVNSNYTSLRAQSDWWGSSISYHEIMNQWIMTSECDIVISTEASWYV